jgi:hypothetical protein
VCRRLCVRVPCSNFSPSLFSTAPVARRDPDLQNVGRGVCPVASSQAINEATYIEWLHKKGLSMVVVVVVRSRKPSTGPTHISSKIACRLISGFLLRRRVGNPSLTLSDAASQNISTPSSGT